MRRIRALTAAATAVAAIGGLTVGAGNATAASGCTFTTSGDTMTLDGSCTTDETIVVPDGMTLDGDGYTITAVDPAGGHFTGGIIENEGATAHVTNVTVTADGLANACDGGADRLRGVLFDGAEGAITHVTVAGLNQGPSGCQEGNAIEVRNAPFDGTHPATKVVEITHNTITDFQKTGIVANGDVDVDIRHNTVGASATQENLAANGIQVGFGASGDVVQNRVEGNQWKGTSDYAASAVLVYGADTVELSRNVVRGNADYGLFVFSDGVNANNNKVFDEGADDPNSSYDVGVGAYGDGTYTNNKVRGFDTPYDGLDPLGTNKVIASPQS